MPDGINILEQPNKFKWRDNPPRVTGSGMRLALKCADNADGMACECWNTKCPNHGDCRKCVVYETCLKQLPTCERDLLEELKEHAKAYAQKA